MSLLYFYDGIFSDTGREFQLTGVHPRFDRLTYRTLEAEDRRRLDDSIIHATIIRQDEPSDDDSSIYLIFERLNTGGLQLHPQEIRASIYHGRFNDILKELNNNPDWRELFGPPSLRLRDQELILRFFVLHYEAEAYNKPMKDFLNRFMGRNRDLSIHSASELTDLFASVVGVVYNGIGRDAFRPQRTVNAAQFDAVMVGVARRQQRGAISNFKLLREAFDRLLSSTDFLQTIGSATTDEEVVARRLELATEQFADVP